MSPARGSPGAPEEPVDEASGAGGNAWPGLMPWHEEILAGWAQRRARAPHGLLLDGPAGIGKRALALHLARTLLCEAPGADGVACGSCAGCRYAMAGTHPDLLLVEPFEVDEDGEVKRSEWISVKAIRRITDWAQVTPHRGRAKVAIVIPADRMNVAAANALLKTLEEPPPLTLIMLVAEQAGRLAATLRSRCQRIALRNPAPDEALSWLQTRGVESAGALLAQAGGAPLAALARSDPALQAERAAWLEALSAPETLSEAALAARLELPPRETRRDRYAAVLDWLLTWVEDLARVAAGGEPAFNPDRAEALSRLASRVARISLFRYHQLLLRQRALVSHPLNQRLAAEALLLDYRALFTA